MRLEKLPPYEEASADQRLSAPAWLAEEAARCMRCPIFRNATQVVFGEGSADAKIMMVGEQPGDQEDRAGRPFVGPAGHVLDRALKEAGLNRNAVYITNMVKHFKHELRGKRRLHKRPNHYEIKQCRWWLDREFAAIEPTLVLALGAAAASALMGRAVVLARDRGRLLRWQDGRAGLATIHLSSVLRMPDESARTEALEGFTHDLRLALTLVKRLDAGAG